MRINVHKTWCGEVVVKVSSDKVVDWFDVQAEMAPAQRELVADRMPSRHTSRFEDRRFEEQWHLSPDAQPGPSPWLCDLCDLEAPVEVTVRFAEGPSEKMCLTCCGETLAAEQEAGYTAPMIHSFFLYPTANRDEVPAGTWNRVGETFRWVSA